MGADSAHGVGTTVDSGLPNIAGKVRLYNEYNKKNYDVLNQFTGPFYWTKVLEDSSEAYGTSTNLSAGSNDTVRNVRFDASHANAIYGASTIVQPPAFFCYFWKRLS